MKEKERTRTDNKKKQKMKELSVISKPAGQHGREYNIGIHFLKLTDDEGRKRFNHILVRLSVTFCAFPLIEVSKAAVREATSQAKLDCEMRFERHDPKRMAYITGQVSNINVHDTEYCTYQVIL